MGRVYEAHDPHLERRVAVKIMHGHDAQGALRFLREARAQAAVAHPGVCPVYEAGEVHGAPYIVMRRLHGRPLHEAAETFSLRQTLEVMHQVAEAVDAAHRTSLVHRDLKPGNILVESDEDGRPRPYVLDFGLARSPAQRGVTVDGSFLGTPGYMAPEQVRGELDQLGPRTDVYSLGATLYRLLAGRPPFKADSPSELRQLLDEEPEPLRRLRVPVEVEAIVFKCLEKEPAQRYASARELAADLQRFLDGQPVLARPAGWWYRTRKRIRRHGALVTVAGVALALLLAALGWGLRSSLAAQERERLARTFTEQVEEVEAMARYSHLSPLHDIRPDRDLLRRRMEAIREEMKGGGSLAQGAGLYALGRGHLALEELKEAHSSLEASWQAGYRGEDAAAAMAQTLSALYREGLAAAELLRDWESRQRRLESLQETYGRPALDFLRQSVGEEPGEQPFLEALLPFHEDRFEEALVALRDSKSTRPWSYELHKLEGDIRRTWATRQSVAGDREEALAELQRALDAYVKAGKIAQSQPSIHRAATQAAVLGMSLEIYTDEALKPRLDEGLEHARRALAANPEDGQAWLWKARLHRLAAQDRRLKSVDPEADLQQAVTAAERSAELLTDPSEALRELGGIHWGWARWKNQRGEDPSREIDAATAALEQVGEPWRDYTFFNTLALARMTEGDHRASRGQDSTASYDQAIDAYREATSRHSEPFGALNNMGTAFLKKSALPGAGQPRALLREAIDAFEAASRIRPGHVAPHYYLGRSYLRLAQGGKETSGRLGEPVDEAIASYRKALEINPGMSQVHSALGEIFHLQAIDAWEHGGDSTPFFQQARATYGAGLEHAPENPLLHLNLAWTAYFEGKFRVREGRDPGPHLEEAIRGARRALALSQQAGALLCLGSAHRLLAEHDLLRRRDPTRQIGLAEAAFQELLSLNPNYPEAYRSLGRLYTLEARWRMQRGGNAEPAFRKGRQALDRALELEDSVASFWLADARWWHHRAARSGVDIQPREALDRGFASTERALALRPGWPEGRAIQARLESRRAALDATGAPEGLAGAERRLRDALAANPHLSFEWGNPPTRQASTTRAPSP